MTGETPEIGSLENGPFDFPPPQCVAADGWAAFRGLDWPSLCSTEQVPPAPSSSSRSQAPQAPPPPLPMTHHSNTTCCNRPLKAAQVTPSLSPTGTGAHRPLLLLSSRSQTPHTTCLQLFTERRPERRLPRKIPLPPFPDAKTYGSPIGAKNSFHLTSPLREKRKMF